jgi:hypothetical protein
MSHPTASALIYMSRFAPLFVLELSTPIDSLLGACYPSPKPQVLEISCPFLSAEAIDHAGCTKSGSNSSKSRAFARCISRDAASSARLVRRA